RPGSPFTGPEKLIGGGAPASACRRLATRSPLQAARMAAGSATRAPISLARAVLRQSLTSGQVIAGGHARPVIRRLPSASYPRERYAYEKGNAKLFARPPASILAEKSRLARERQAYNPCKWQPICRRDLEDVMEHKTLDEIRDVAEVQPSWLGSRPLTKCERLERWAEVLERRGSQRLKTMYEIEYLSR